MHAGKNAFPWLGCKGSDSVVVLKFLRFYVALILGEGGQSPSDQQALKWMLSASENGLAFTQGIHGHSIWLVPSCVRHFRNSVNRFGIAYAHLAAFCMGRGYCLYGMVPKLHALMHFRTDFDDSLREQRPHTLNPAVFDNSMSEDFIGKVARQSRRVPFKNIEKTIINAYQVKAKIVIDKFQQRHRQPKA